MVWVFQWLRSFFFTLIFLEKRWNSGTHFDVQKYSHAKKVTWICHGISPWMRDCIIDRLRQNSVARMQFSSFSFFATFWLWPISICFTKSPQKHATNRGEQQILQSIMMILASVSFCFTIPWFTTRKQAWFQCFNAPQWFHLRHHTVARTHTMGSNSFCTRILKS